jgi:hypothetical protein
MSDAKVAITVDALKEILAAQSTANQEALLAVLQEARKPVVTEEQQKTQEFLVQSRARTADQIKEKEARDAAMRKACPHRHKNGSPRVVHVKNHPNCGGEWMLCQKCRDVIRPESRPELFYALLADMSAVIEW